MKTGSTNQSGYFRNYLFEYVPNPDPPYSGMVQTTNSDISAFAPNKITRALSVVSDNKGNKKDPTLQEFYISQRTSLHGRVTSTRFDSKGRLVLEAGNTGFIGGGDVGLVPIRSSGIAYAKALSRLNDKVRGDLDISIDIAEAHQVKPLLKSLPPVSFGDTTWYTKDTKGTKWGRVAGLARAFSSASLKRKGEAWLAYVYGLKPLASSIYGAIQEVTQPPRPYWFRSEGRASNVISSSTSIDTGGDFGPDSTVITSLHEIQRCQIKVQLALASANLDLARFGTLNPLGIAWELLPYSFVADWFCDIGGYLRALETSLFTSSSFVSGFVTETVKQEVTRNQFGQTHFTNGEDVWDVEDSLILKWKKRTPLLDYPMPRTPIVSPHLGWSRLLSAASLFSLFLEGGAPHGVPKIQKRRKEFNWDSISDHTPRRS